jgi:amino acid permease
VSSSLTTRQAPKWVTVLLGVLAVLLLAVAVIYFVEPAHQLPSFFPGHTRHGTKARVKHGVAAAVVAALLIAATWFSAARKRAT